MAIAPETLANAVQHHQAGRLHAAEQIYRQVLEVQPGHADALHLLGVVQAQTGDHQLAVEFIERALQVRPDWPEALANLGNALNEQGRLDDAIRHLQRALQLKPDFAQAHNQLGTALKKQGNLIGAVASYRRALELKPDLADVHHNLGLALNDQGQRDEAIACYRRAIELNPDYAEAHNNLGNAFRDQGRLDEAAARYRRTLELVPGHAAVHNNLSVALKDLGKLDEAIVCCRRALELKPDYAHAHNSLGNVLREQGNLDDAVACYRRALELKSDVAEVHNNLGGALKEQGKMDEAVASLRRAIQLKPNYAEALAAVAELLRARLPADELAALAQLASSPEVSVGGRASAHFGMAAVKDAEGDYAAAAQHLRHANSLRLADHQAHDRAYEPDVHERWVAAIIDVFSAAHFARVRGFGVDSERPVFVFGLPRTGTTLTEQILAGHSKMFGAGELRLAGLAFQSLPQVTMKRAKPLECVAALDRQAVEIVARRYLDRLAAIDNSALRIVDKMPENYLHLGLLTTLFPKAKFIHCRRDVRDVALSCWMTNFRHVYWSNDIDQIGARFRDYERLMEHWRRVLPARFLDVDYETTVTDVEGTARRLVDWCGLEWEPQCLSFHTRREPVRTASVAQVRQPIFQHAVGRWKHYEKELAPLFAAVSARHAPTIDTGHGGRSGPSACPRAWGH